MCRKPWPKEHYDYLKEIAIGRYNDEITKLMNEKFETNYTEVQVKNAKVRKGIRSGVSRYNPNSHRGLFSKEQQIYIKSIAKGRLNQELADLVNEKFGLSITAKQINTWKKNNRVVSELDCRFESGHIPWNKGMKGIDLCGKNGKKTQFKKGNKPMNYRSVGSERITVDGYVEVKIKDPGEWRLKHQVVWEQANGKIPKGHAVIFGDGDRQNLDLNNLILVSRSQLAILNRYKLIKSNTELTKTGIIIANLKSKISKRQKGSKKA